MTSRATDAPSHDTPEVPSPAAQDYDAPHLFENLHEISTASPVENIDESRLYRRRESLEDAKSTKSGGSKRRRRFSRPVFDDGTTTSAAANVRHEDGGDNAGRQHEGEGVDAQEAESDETIAAPPLHDGDGAGDGDYDIPHRFENLDEIAAASPVDNVHEEAIYRRKSSLEETRSADQRERRRRRSSAASAANAPPGQPLEQDGRDEEPSRVSGLRRLKSKQASRLATEIYTVSYLVFFSLLGTLARLGLGALTTYPGAPTFSSVWFNFAGCVVMGFLAEERVVFRDYAPPPKTTSGDDGGESGEKEMEREMERRPSAVEAAEKKAHLAMKKSIPLYIGLTTGFCGSFTSFSAFIRDIFLATSNDLVVPGTTGTVARDGGYSFEAALAVVLVTVCMSLGGLFGGAHLAIAVQGWMPSLPRKWTRKVLDKGVIVFGWGCWLGAVLLSVLPPDREETGDGATERWRGSATFALVFAPVGCLMRFYASLHLNGKIASFPLGTFVVNIFGTAVLGMAWDLAHVPLGGVVGCQVLQGVEDGFCGCLTTVSTWVAELAALRRRHAYVYGLSSVLVGFGVLVLIMGGLRWTNGFAALQCMH